METKDDNNDVKKGNVSKNEDISQEEKSDISDERKSNLASKGFGAIIFISVALGLIYFLISSGSKKVEAPQDDRFDISIEQKVFTPPAPPAIELPIEQNKSANIKSAEPEEKKSVVIKSLNGAMVASSSSHAASSNTQVDSSQQQTPYQAAIERNKAYIQEVGSRNNMFQEQIMSLLNGNREDDYDTGQTVIESSTATVVAKKSTINPNLSLDKGTFIPCVLKTQIISTVAGNVACIITDDIYSSAGTVLLIEKGSTVQGVFKKGEMKLGVERLYVIWEEIKTPKRVIININSGATDPLGGSGIEGYVDNHWMTRFGSAIMLSMIDDALSFALGRARNDIDAESAYYYTEGTRSTSLAMAETVLQQTINIPPTLYKNHGDIVGIYVNKDVDFSQVYKLIKDNK
ncbi:MAG: type IV secretion system protein VirB10 [Campylobacteraceae bacterium]|jgi:type IV secretion system protein VirB10|nr:type IV secretion system protein VirB10 [Campylobacteraceae bacterium]